MKQYLQVSLGPSLSWPSAHVLWTKFYYIRKEIIWLHYFRKGGYFSAVKGESFLESRCFYGNLGMILNSLVTQPLWDGLCCLKWPSRPHGHRNREEDRRKWQELDRVNPFDNIEVKNLDRSASVLGCAPVQLIIFACCRSTFFSAIWSVC